MVSLGKFGVKINSIFYINKLLLFCSSFSVNRKYYFSNPIFLSFVPIYSFITSSVIYIKFCIASILLQSTNSKITFPVIEGVAVDMVDYFILWTFHNKTMKHNGEVFFSNPNSSLNTIKFSLIPPKLIHPLKVLIVNKSVGDNLLSSVPQWYALHGFKQKTPISNANLGRKRYLEGLSVPRFSALSLT